jgi:hypothetical protein
MPRSPFDGDMKVAHAHNLRYAVLGLRSRIVWEPFHEMYAPPASEDCTSLRKKIEYRRGLMSPRIRMRRS